MVMRQRKQQNGHLDQSSAAIADVLVIIVNRDP